MSFMDTDSDKQFIEDSLTQQEPEFNTFNRDPIKAQAALLALSEKSLVQAQDSYNNLMQGVAPDVSGVVLKTQQQSQAAMQEMLTALPSILSDPTISVAQKDKLISQIRRGELKAPDVASRVVADLAIKEHGSDDYSDKVITKSVRDLSLEAQDQWARRQSVVNAATAGRDGTMKKVADFFGLFAPMADAAMMTGVTHAAGKSETTKELGSNPIYSMALPGSSFAEFHKKFHKMSYDQQTAVLGELTNAINNSSSLLTSDNQLRALSFVSDLQNPEYSNFEKYFTNSMNILDAIQIGYTVKAVPALAKGVVALGKGLAERFASKPAKGIGDAWNMRNTDPAFLDEAAMMARNPEMGTSAPSGFTPDDLAKTTGTPTRQGNSQRIQELEAQHSDLLGENLVPLEKGEVTKLQKMKEQLQETLADRPNKKPRQREAVAALRDRNQSVEGQIRRIDDALEQNAIAQRNIEQISSIEKELSTLRKSKDVEEVPKTELSSAIERAFMQGTVFTHNPRTAGNLAMNSNPNEARNMLMVVAASESDEVAQALYGVSKNEALIKSVAPQVTDSSGRVKYVTPDMEQNIRRQFMGSLDRTIFDPVGGIQFTEAEIAAGRAAIVNDYSNAVGVKLHPAVTSIASEADGSKVTINAVYGAGDTGWLTPEDAIKQTSFALRSRGITAEDITILRREGDELVPVKASDVAGVEGEYFARISVDDYIHHSDMSSMDQLSVKKNFLDRLFGTGTNQWGSLQSHVLPITSMLDKHIVGSATVGTDKTSVLAEALLTKLDSFSTPFMSLSKERRAKMMDYIEEANAKELPFSRSDLNARGFTDPEIDALSHWREFWDMDHRLENLDVVRTLDGQGYEWLDHPNLQAVVKPKGKNYGITMVYDAAADVVRPIDRAEIDEIYRAGGNIGEFKRPIDIDGVSAEHVIVRNNPSEFTRKLRDSDQILQKREGYYQVHHKAARYIEETFRDNTGKVRTTVVGTTGSIKDAEAATELLNKRGNGKTYSHRGEERGIERGSNEYWDLHTSGGRIAQRHRGDLIQNNVGLQSLGMANYVENPVEAGLKAAASISGRTAMRPVLDTAKERFMQQYGHLVVGDDGLKSFPQSLDQILKKGDPSSKELADARTTWGYIHYLENGYINTVDDIYKKGMRLMADWAGYAGHTGTERALRTAEEVKLSSAYKSTVFGAMLGSNPLRQIFIQANQGTRAFAYNPQGFASGSVAKYFAAFTNDAMGLPMTQSMKDFKSFMMESGMFQAISKNNLIRDTLLEASGKTSRTANMLNKVPETMRKVGFDVGEKTNLIAHGAAVYDEFVRAGKNVKDARVKAEMHDRIRAITLDMNFAGDMPYNQNGLSFLMTYMQIPHKAITAITSRRIPADVRNRMMAYDLAMWGLPTEAFGRVMDLEGISPEDPEVRRLVENGLQAWYLNKMWEEMSDEPQGVDYSSLNPMGMDNWVKMVQAMWFDGGVSKVLDSSAGSKVIGLGMDSRLGVALNMTGAFFKDFYEEPEDMTTLLDVVDSWGRISSGWSNIQKARMQWALGVAKDKSGNVIDSHVSKIEAINQVFGFPTEDVGNYYKTLERMKKGKANIKELVKKDVDTWIQLANVRENGQGPNLDSLRMHSKLMKSTQRFLTPQQSAEYMKQVAERMRTTPEATMWKELASGLGYTDMNSYIDTVRRAPGLSEAQKAQIEKVFNQNRDITKTLMKQEGK